MSKNKTKMNTVSQASTGVNLLVNAIVLNCLAQLDIIGTVTSACANAIHKNAQISSMTKMNCKVNTSMLHGAHADGYH